MSWEFLAASSYFLSAFSQTLDKVLLQARIPSAATYAFYSGVTSVFVVVLVPFIHRWADFLLSIPIFALAFATGAMLVVALYFLYTSLRRCDVSRIVPIIGAAIPIFLLVFAVARGAPIVSYQFIAVFLFVAGGMALAMEIRQQNNGYDSLVAHLLGMPGQRLALCSSEPRKGIGAAIAAAVFFAGTFFV